MLIAVRHGRRGDSALTTRNIFLAAYDTFFQKPEPLFLMKIYSSYLLKKLGQRKLEDVPGHKYCKIGLLTGPSALILLLKVIYHV